MKILKIFAHFILLFIMPVSLVYSHSNLPCVTFQEMNYGYQHNTQEWIRPTTYDEIMQMLEDLESGELERKCSPIQIERVNEYLITLAKKGILPDEFEEEMDLEEDAYDLMYGEDSAFQLAHSLGMNNEYMIIPVVLNAYSDYDIVQCGKINKAWKNTKKFVKKHKKAIIIGSVVVVAATVVVVAVVAASSVTADTAAAGVSGVAASGASSGSNSSNFNCSESGKSESKEESPSVSAVPKETSSPIANEMPIMKAAINEHISSFKEFLAEDKALQEAASFKEWDDLSFGEKARELGANVAHQAFDEIIDLVKVVPQLCEEVKEVGSKLLPESLTPSNGENGSPIENYDNFVAKGHQVIDKVFSTDQSEYFTVEAKANDPGNNFAVGVIPFPGVFSGGKFNVKKLSDAGNVIDRGGFAKAGRNLMKHGYKGRKRFSKTSRQSSSSKCSRSKNIKINP